MQPGLSAKAIITKGLDALALPHTPEQVNAFTTYLAELKKWNKMYNLTAIKTDADIIIKHFLDSLLYLKAMPATGIKVMDVGSGAGFPGIPIKIMRPDIYMYLLEPTGKKANFLRHTIKVLGLDRIEVVGKRIEEVKSITVDIAVTRALFDIRDFCKKAFPVLKDRGSLILSKGPKVDEEIKKITGKNINYELLPLRLPLSDITRFLVIIRREPGSAVPTGPVSSKSPDKAPPASQNICINAECRMRKAGCRGFEWCPGFKSKS